MLVSVQQIVTDALRLVGQSGAPERGISPEQLSEGTRFLNYHLDSWNALRSSIFTIRTDRYTLTPSQTSYTIGPTGDFIADRPIRIENANLVLTNSSPEVFNPLALWNDDQWAAVSVEEIPTTVPVALYNDYADPNSTLFLWGYPTQANDLQLFTWQALPTTLGSGDDLQVPTAYMPSIISSLAVRFIPLYRKDLNAQAIASLELSARKDRAALAGLNQAAPLLVNDAAFQQGGTPIRPYWNFLTGRP